MHFSFANIIPWIIHYKYFVILPISIFEGPIIGILSGFLASLGYLKIWVALPILILGDLIGDSMYYAIGRFGRERLIIKYGHYIGITLEKIQRMESFFEKNTNKTMIFGKFAHGTGFLMWIATGIIKMPYRTFVLINFYTTTIKVSILLLIGFYFGKAYQTIDSYSNYVALAIAILLVAVYLVTTRTSLLDRFFKLNKN